MSPATGPGRQRHDLCPGTRRGRRRVVLAPGGAPARAGRRARRRRRAAHRRPGGRARGVRRRDRRRDRDAADDATDVTLVAQSMGAFSAPLACDRIDVRRIVLVNAMVPRPGETPGEWWEATGQVAARREHETAEGRDPDAPFDVREGFFHDVPPEVTRAAFARAEKGQADRPFGEPWPLAAWPDVPTDRRRGPRRPAVPGGLPAPPRAGSGSASSSTCCPAATCSPCRSRRRWLRTCTADPSGRAVAPRAGWRCAGPPRGRTPP